MGSIKSDHIPLTSYNNDDNLLSDNKLLSKKINEALKDVGFEVLHTDKQETVIEYVPLNNLGPAFLNIIMPKMDGIGVLALLDQNEKVNLIPFIIIKSLAHKFHIKIRTDSEADDHITKPITIENLTRITNAQIEKYYTPYIGVIIKNIKNNINAKLITLKQTISIQHAQINEISETNNKLSEQIKSKESKLFEEEIKTIELSNTILLLRNQIKKEIIRKDLPEDQKTVFQQFIYKIERICSKKNNWRSFQIRFCQVYPNLLSKFIQHYPKLTQLELTMISAILFNLNSIQVSEILNISPQSVRKSRYRLKKKLKVCDNESLLKFIHEFQFRK